MDRVSLILPVYNEGISILNTLKEITQFFESLNYDFEIIVVDDKSNDESVDIIKNFDHPKVRLICKTKNGGKGGAIKEGMTYASKDYVGFMDADLPYHLENIRDMVNELKDYDLAIGSREVEGAVVEAHPMWYRKSLSKIFCKFRDLLFKLNIPDTQSGLKFFKKDIAEDIFNKQRIRGFGFDTEILYIAKKKGYSIKQVPVHLLKEHSFKRSKLNPIKDSFKIFWDLVSIKINDLKGKYE